MKLLLKSAALFAIVIPSSLAAQTSPSAYTTAARYDALGRTIGKIAPDPDGTGPLKFMATRVTYDARGNVSVVETGELSTWQSESVAPASWGAAFAVLKAERSSFDENGRKLTDRIDGSNGVTISLVQYSYDFLGRLECTAQRMNPAAYQNLPGSACILGAEGSNGPDRITRNVYNSLGQLVTVQKAVGTPIQQDYVTYTYTINGKQASVLDANGNLATLTYDSYDRLFRWNFPSKAAAGETSTTDYEEYAYDANGNRVSLRKRDGSVISFSYDALNRNTVKIVPERAGLSPTHTRDVYYGYDLRGLQTFARFDSAFGEGMTNTYDGFGRLASFSQSMDGTTRTLTYTYDKNSNRTRVTYPDGNNFQFGYDGLNRMRIIGNNAASGLVSYGYNNRGARGSITSGSITSYAYDAVGQLTGLTQNLAGTVNDVTYGMAYNPTSQITTRTTSNSAYFFAGGIDVNRSYSVNGLNQYTMVGAAFLTYDPNGNLTGDGSSSYLYDVENRLVSASGATSATLRYDPLGRLYETSGGSAGVTRFLYDGDELVGEYNSAGTILRRYVHGSGVDDPMAWYEGATVAAAVAKLIKTNHQGSVVALTNSSGNLTNINRYDEYGIPASTNAGRFQYTGQAWIPELGMYYYKARIYAPSLGRFMQTDPIGYRDQINLYTYVANDPLNNTDPTGMVCWTCMGRAVGVAGGRAGTSLLISQADSPLPGPADVAAATALVVTAGALVWDVGNAILKNESSEGPKTPAPTPAGQPNSGERRSKTPNAGPPGSTHVNPGSGQVRHYGPDGKPIRDIDYDHDHGQGVPHEHEWTRDQNGNPVRGPGKPVKPEENRRERPADEPPPPPRRPFGW